MTFLNELLPWITDILPLWDALTIIWASVWVWVIVGLLMHFGAETKQQRTTPLGLGVLVGRCKQQRWRVSLLCDLDSTRINCQILARFLKLQTRDWILEGERPWWINYEFVICECYLLVGQVCQEHWRFEQGTRTDASGRIQLSFSAGRLWKWIMTSLCICATRTCVGCWKHFKGEQAGTLQAAHCLVSRVKQCKALPLHAHLPFCHHHVKNFIEMNLYWVYHG